MNTNLRAEIDENLSPDNVLKNLYELCSYGARWPGLPGNALALAFLQKKIAEYAKGPPSLQGFQYLGFTPERTHVLVHENGLTIPGEVLGYSQPTPPQGFSAEVIFVGEGRTEDYENLGGEAAVKGKIVVSNALKSYQAYPVAERYGAAAFILISSLKEDVIRVGVTNYERLIGSIPAIAVSSSFFNRFMEIAEKALKVSINTKSTTGWAIGNNVISMNSTISQQRILVIAHYDSMWVGPHAFDDASGVAIQLELLRVFKKCLPDAPIDFVFFDAEELGFWGSRAFVQQHACLITHYKTILCLDGAYSDLAGLEIGVTSDIEKEIRIFLQDQGIKVDKWSIPPRPNSDHVAFEQFDLPVVWITGMDPYYHTALDVPSNVGEQGLRVNLMLAARILLLLTKQVNLP